MSSTLAWLEAATLSSHPAIACLVVFVAAMLPLFPSEAVVVTAAALSAQGHLDPAGTAFAAALGAVAGDCLTYRAARWRRDGAGLWCRSGGGRRGKMFERADQALHRHGSAWLVTARFVPGGRTAGAYVAGVVRIPFRRFACATLVGACLWAGVYTAIGFVGGGFSAEWDVCQRHAGVSLTSVALCVGVCAAVVSRREASQRRQQRREPRAHRRA